MKKMNLIVFAFLLCISVCVTPAFALGPENAEEKNPNVVIDGYNTQMWLPSGVMNEWIENPMAPGPFRVTLKDASKFQIKSAIVPLSILEIFANENQWFYFSHDDFADFRIQVGKDPALADNYPEGVYIKLIMVGW